MLYNSTSFLSYLPAGMTHLDILEKVSGSLVTVLPPENGKAIKIVLGGFGSLVSLQEADAFLTWQIVS